MDLSITDLDAAGSRREESILISWPRVPKLIIAHAGSVPPVLSHAADPAVQVWRDQGGMVCAYSCTVSGQYWMYLPGLAAFRFDGTSDKVIAITPPSMRPDLIQDAYHRTVLPFVLQATGLEVLHASAILTSQGVVALCAASGTGKSTIAYGLSRRGYPLWADDAVAFETSGQWIRAIPVPFRMRFRPDAASFFNQDLTAAQSRRGLNSDDRVETEPGRLAALCVLEPVPRVGDRTAVEALRLSSTQAFTAVLAHAYCFSLQDLERKRRMMEHYLDLIGRVPVFEIRFEPGLEKLPAILDAIEQAGAEESLAGSHLG